MRSCRSLRIGRFVFAILVTLAGVLTLPLSSSAWPGAHKTLQCVDCHLVMPDPKVDTVDTVTFVNSNQEELCLGCHESMRDGGAHDAPMMMFATMAAATSTNFKHKSSAIVPQSMYDHYVQWIAQNGSNYTPALTVDAIRMSPSGSDHYYSCNACHVGMGGGYPPIPMTNLELCVACHGGEGNRDVAGADPRFSGSPRILINPTNLGVTDGVNEYPPPPAGIPASGAHVDGPVSFPLAVVKSFHTSVQENLAYRIEINYNGDENVDKVVTTFPERIGPFTPMRWYTGAPPRWSQEMELHQEEISAWPTGTHVLKIIPYDPISQVDGNAYTLSLTKGSTTSGKTPVLFIPGLMATRLYKSGGQTQVWASTWDFIWDIGDDFLDPLEMSRDGNSDINDRITVYNNSPNGPAEDVSGYKAWDKYIFADYNQSLFESLKEAGYRPAKGDDVGDFSFYAYDWRRAPENETIRTDLNARIDQLLTANSAQKVDIVAHSLGGLVLKDYLANLPPDKADKIGKVILVGTPHLGAVKAFRAVQFGQLDFGFPSEIFMNENKIMQISQNWPVVYALSPSEAFCDTSQAGYVDIFQEKDVDLNKKDGYTTWSLTDLDNYYHDGTYYKNWYSNPREVTTENQKHNGLLADAAKDFHRDRDALSTWAGNAEQVFLLAGQQTNTLQRLELFKNPEENFPGAMGLTTYWMSGDGTVPTKSASLDFESSAGNVSRYFIRNVEHAALVAENRETTDFVRDILLNQIPAELSSNISNTPFADTVSGRHIEVNCPVEVHVYDAQGRHTGPINSREVEKGLKKVDYERYHAANGFSTSIFLPPENVYRIVIVSQGSGTFRLTNRTIQDDIISQTVIYDEMPLTPQTIGYLTLDPQTAVPPLSIDVNGDQQIDLVVEAAVVIASDERADRIPPVTSVAYMGSLGQNGFYTSNVSLILNASDGPDGTGVKKTEYSLDGGSWTRYLNPVTLSEGCRREVRYRSLDYSHNQEDSNSSLVKIDKSTPTIQSVTMTPNLLWPPNHRMVEVVPSVLVTDNCSASPVWAIERIQMNEGDTESTYDPNFDANLQAGNTNGDIQIIGGKIYLRAERAGNSAGRMYTIVVKATDEAGNVARAEAMVLVPHDQR